MHTFCIAIVLQCICIVRSKLLDAFGLHLVLKTWRNGPGLGVTWVLFLVPSCREVNHRLAAAATELLEQVLPLVLLESLARLSDLGLEVSNLERITLALATYIGLLHVLRSLELLVLLNILEDASHVVSLDEHQNDQVDRQDNRLDQSNPQLSDRTWNQGKTNDSDDDD